MIMLMEWVRITHRGSMDLHIDKFVGDFEAHYSQHNFQWVIGDVWCRHADWQCLVVISLSKQLSRWCHEANFLNNFHYNIFFHSMEGDKMLIFTITITMHNRNITTTRWSIYVSISIVSTAIILIYITLSIFFRSFSCIEKYKFLSMTWQYQAHAGDEFTFNVIFSFVVLNDFMIGFSS